MRARAVRSGLTESYHEGAVAVIGIDGDLIYQSGDQNRPFFFRSAIKPVQAAISLESGADLTDEELAVACASHGGQPVHLALVRSILAGAGLQPEALRCPPEWPRSDTACDRLLREGVASPAPIMHNCSGKHAAALAACVASGWPLEGYLEPAHPYQQRVVEAVARLSGETPEPVGVDGCGFPTLRGSVVGLARIFAAVAADDRFARVRRAMHSFPALTADAVFPEAAIASWVNGVAKGGAMACAGVALTGRLGIGAKMWDASYPALWACLIEVLDRLGSFEPFVGEALSAHRAPPLLGGGRPVGAVEPQLD
jgi:L-asparaginase II